MSKHRDVEDTGIFRLFSRARKRDDLFERSFNSCGTCGADVYVLSEECRHCDTTEPAEPAYAGIPAFAQEVVEAIQAVPVGASGNERFDFFG